MVNLIDNIKIIVVIILLGFYICIKKVENKSGIFAILVLKFGIILIFANSYINLSNPNRASQCLNQLNHVIKNRNIIPIRILKPHLLFKPFNEFFISTSHNTYLPCYQNGDIASVDAISLALKMGARVIELDVFTKNNLGCLPEDYEPIVTHGIKLNSGDIFTTEFLLFSECVQTIKKFSDTTSDPIWLEIELNTDNPQTQKVIKQIIQQIFSTKLLGPEYKIKNKVKHFSQEPIKNLLDKIIITTSKKINILDDYLSDVFDSYVGDGYYLNNSTSCNINKANNQIQRVYPQANISGHFSLNYDPEPFWKKHVQLVAMNFQTLDNHMVKNLTMFKSCSFIHVSEFEIKNSNFDIAL